MEVHIEHIREGDRVEWRGVCRTFNGIVDKVITHPRKLYLVALSTGKYVTVSRESLRKFE